MREMKITMVKMNFNDISADLTEEEIAELEAAEEKAEVFDADSPERTQAMLTQFKKMNQISRVVTDKEGSCL